MVRIGTCADSADAVVLGHTLPHVAQVPVNIRQWPSLKVKGRNHGADT